MKCIVDSPQCSALFSAPSALSLANFWSSDAAVDVSSLLSADSKRGGGGAYDVNTVNDGGGETDAGWQRSGDEALTHVIYIIHIYCIYTVLHVYIYCLLPSNGPPPMVQVLMSRHRFKYERALFYCI